MRCSCCFPQGVTRKCMFYPPLPVCSSSAHPESPIHAYHPSWYPLRDASWHPLPSHPPGTESKRVVYALISSPASTGHSPNAVSMLGQRQRRWANVGTALGEYPVFTGRLQRRGCGALVEPLTASPVMHASRLEPR